MRWGKKAIFLLSFQELFQSYGWAYTAQFKDFHFLLLWSDGIGERIFFLSEGGNNRSKSSLLYLFIVYHTFWQSGRNKYVHQNYMCDYLLLLLLYLVNVLIFQNAFTFISQWIILWSSINNESSTDCFVIDYIWL